MPLASCDRVWSPAKLTLISHSRLIQYCTNTKDFMVPSMWGSVSTYRQHPMLNGAKGIRASCMTSLANITRLSSGRQARRSICTTTIKWLLHHHVKLSYLLGLAFDGFFSHLVFSMPFPFSTPQPKQSVRHKTNRFALGARHKARA